MRKTTVYLTESEAEGLRRAAGLSKRSQSELIREGVRLVADRVSAERRVFHSMGAGSGGGPRTVDRGREALYRRKVLGERD